MREDPLHDLIGVKLMVAVAGFLGGVIQLAWNRDISVWGAIISVLAGVCSAAFGTPMVSLYYHLPVEVENGTAFLLGLLGMLIAGKLYKFAAGLSMERLFALITKKGGGGDE